MLQQWSFQVVMDRIPTRMAGNTAFWFRKALAFPQRRRENIVPPPQMLTGQGIEATAKLQGQQVEAFFEKMLRRAWNVIWHGGWKAVICTERSSLRTDPARPLQEFVDYSGLRGRSCWGKATAFELEVVSEVSCIPPHGSKRVGRMMLIHWIYRHLPYFQANACFCFLIYALFPTSQVRVVIQVIKCY